MINVKAIHKINVVYVPSLAAGFPLSELRFSPLGVLSHLAHSGGHLQALLLPLYPLSHSIFALPEAKKNT